MNVLVLNESPKGTLSNTYKLTTSFIEGLTDSSSYNIDTILISQKNIKPCLGCFHCWKNDPGKCVIQDDMAELLSKYINADLIIWSFPLYYFGMPSPIKGFLDRMLPTNLPFIHEKGENTASHPGRYDLSLQRHILISTCGFHTTQGNYESLIKQFETMFHHKFVSILCPEGELLQVPELSSRINEYLQVVKEAGQEYSTNQCFSESTQNKLNELLYPTSQFLEMANASWGDNAGEDNTQTNVDNCFSFLKQMAAIYNPKSYKNDLVLEFFFTDCDKTYQLWLQKEKCIVARDHFKESTTRIEISFDLWQKISANEVSGSQALFEGKYKVSKDIKFLMNIDEYFGYSAQDSAPKKKTNMTIFLLPFFGFWFLTSINQTLTGIISILLAAIVPLMYHKYKKVFYETLSAISCTIIGLLYILLPQNAILFALPNFILALFWLASCTKIPLCAYYSSNDYGQEKAFKNPIFMKTNLILAFAWGIETFVMSFVSLFIANTSFAPYWGIVSGIIPALLMLFTNWFSAWYPSKIANQG